MKEVNTGRSTRMARPSVISTWRSAAKHERAPVRIAATHLEKEQRLENALDEYCQLRQQNRSLTASQFCERYPSYRHSLRRLIDVHEALADQPGLEDENWPELCSEFLGYEILHELGVGAIARVYLATELALGGRLVAIKVAQEGGDEAETLGKLTHPNIVPVFSVKHDEATNLTAVCMPYHGSATLSDVLEFGFQDGVPPSQASVILDAAREREQVADFVDGDHHAGEVDPVLLRGTYVDGVVRLGIQMAEALAYTHERGILHRDLKPSNVLLTPSGVPMLLDFNLASDMEMGASRLGGTLPYMPPEQIRDVHLHPLGVELTGDPRSDVFSLAVILYELLTGRLPFGDPPACEKPRQAAEAFLQAQQQAPRPIRELNPAVSSEVARLLHRCLALEPSERPQSAASLAGELQSYFSPRRKIRRWTVRHRGSVTMFAMLMFLGISAASWHLANRPPFEVGQYAAGVEDFGRRRFEDAAKHFGNALTVMPDSDVYRFARGVSLQQSGNHEAAIADFERVQTLSSPLVSECKAYSAANMPGRDVIARAFYKQLSSTAPDDATIRLNLAFCYFLAPRYELSGHAVSEAEEVIRRRPDWQAAYHLLALTYRNRAILSERRMGKLNDKSLAEIESRERQLAIDKAIGAIDRALDLGENDVFLVRDALMIYTMRHADADLSRLQELFEIAVRCGLPRHEIQRFGVKQPWRESPWFTNVLERSQIEGTVPATTLAERFLTPPDYQSIVSRLALTSAE